MNESESENPISCQPTGSVPSSEDSVQAPPAAQALILMGIAIVLLLFHACSVEDRLSLQQKQNAIDLERYMARMKKSSTNIHDENFWVWDALATDAIQRRFHFGKTNQF